MLAQDLDHLKPECLVCSVRGVQFTVCTVHSAWSDATPVLAWNEPPNQTGK
jgi:hypothetical protein